MKCLPWPKPRCRCGRRISIVTGWRREAGGLPRVDKFGRNHQDEEAGCGAGGGHPQPLTAGAPAGFRKPDLAFGLRARRLRYSSSLYGSGEGEDSNEKEDVILDDQADQGHFGLLEGRTRFGSSWRPVTPTGNHHHQDGGGHIETAEIDADGAADGVRILFEMAGMRSGGCQVSAGAPSA